MVKISLGSELVATLSYSHRLKSRDGKIDKKIVIMSLNSFPSLSVDGLN